MASNADFYIYKAQILREAAAAYYAANIRLGVLIERESRAPGADQDLVDMCSKQIDSNNKSINELNNEIAAVEVMIVAVKP